MVKTQFIVNHLGIMIHKLDYKKGRRRQDYDIYKENRSITPKEEVVTRFDLGYLGIEKDFPDQLSSLPNRKKRGYETVTKRNRI